MSGFWYNGTIWITKRVYMSAVYVFIQEMKEVKRLSLLDSDGHDMAKDYLKNFCNFPNDRSVTEDIASRLYGHDCYILSLYDYQRFNKTLDIMQQTNEFFTAHPQHFTQENLNKLAQIRVIDPLATVEKRLETLMLLQ